MAPLNDDWVLFRHLTTLYSGIRLRERKISGEFCDLAMLESYL